LAQGLGDEQMIGRLDPACAGMTIPAASLEFSQTAIPRTRASRARYRPASRLHPVRALPAATLAIPNDATAARHQSDSFKGHRERTMLPQNGVSCRLAAPRSMRTWEPLSELRLVTSTDQFAAGDRGSTLQLIFIGFW